MKACALFFLAVLTAAIPGCIDYRGPHEVCDGIACSDHGTCQAVDDVATCDCDPGYEPDPGNFLACIAVEDGPVIVDIVTGIEDPSAGLQTIHLRDHPDVNLAEGDIHLMFLETSQTYASPVYLEIEVESRLILEVLVPYDSPVHALRDQDDYVEVELVYSAAIHVLMRDHRDFAAMLAELQQSLDDGTHRLVTETRDSHQIIDVRLPLDPS